MHLPALERAIEVLDKAPVRVGADYLETADHVREGAFAITGELTEKAVADVREQLSKAILEGKSQKEFIETVADRLEEEGSPLSIPHIENVFRTNTMSAYSKAQEEAVSHPVVSDAFPYATYYATHDARVRPEHLAMEKYSPPKENWKGGGPYGLDGTNVYRFDDPVFKAFRPPWHYNCRCSWVPTTVEQAAKKGVKEASDWLERAKALAKVQGGSFYQYLASTAPSSPAHVNPPPFEVPPEFKKE